MTPGDMTGRVALVTGAANGLGRETALALAKAGADIALVDRDAERLASAAAEIEALGVRALPHQADLTSRDACFGAVAATVETFGRLDALCNVAGVNIFAHTPEMSAADYDLIMAVNLHAPFYLCQAAIPHLLKGDGAIVNVTSAAAYIGEAYLAAYCATKAGLTQMTKALAMEYAKTSLRVNGVAPGGMLTPMSHTMKIPEGIDRELVSRYVGLRGVVEVTDVANAIGFLASPAAVAFHGACINVDRGSTAG